MLQNFYHSIYGVKVKISEKGKHLTIANYIKVVNSDKKFNIKDTAIYFLQ